jgi:hypothetical protein
VEDGVPFCKHCGAPQIRVAVEPQAPLTSPELTSQVIQTAEITAPSEGGPARTFPIAAFAGLLEALFSFFGLGIVMGGFLTVALYHRRNASAGLNPGVGARLGLISGAIGFGVFAVLRAVELAVFRDGLQLRDQVMKSLEQAATQYPAAQAQQMLQYFQSPQGWALIVAMSTVFTLLAFLMLSTIGGVIGAWALARKKQV